MRTVIQRVQYAHITINKSFKRSINKGLLILLGIENDDTAEDIDWLAGKISRLRIFDDENGKMNLSVQQINGEVMVVSQFTLFANVKKGNRPSWIRAAGPEIAEPMYEQFVLQLEQYTNKEIIRGEFGAHMDIELLNDGPVTIIIDSKENS